MSYIDYNIKNYLNWHADENSMNIGIIIKGTEEAYVATSYIRLISIFDNISEDNNYNPCLIDAMSLKKVMENLELNLLDFDIIIIQRDVLTLQFAKKLIHTCNLLNIPIIYEIDDDLINIDETHPEYEHYQVKIKGIRYLLENSNAVTVSTEYLKNKFIQFNHNIFVIPNVVTSFWNRVHASPKKHNSNKELIIGYMGTSSHKEDLKIVEKSVNNVISYFKINHDVTVKFQSVGFKCEDIINSYELKVPNNKKNYPDFIIWLNKNINWDVAIAPLNKTNINESKSQIKYLDYASLNIPGIYSDFGPYSSCIIHNKNGLLSNNDDSWEKNLIKLLEDNILRKTIIFNSKKDLIKNYALKKSVVLWKQVIDFAYKHNNVLLERLIKKFRKTNNISFEDFVVSNSVEIIKNSGLFDEKYYLTEYPDVSLSKFEPIEHYLNFGIYENCNPNFEFNENFGELFESKVNPFVQYILYSCEKFPELSYEISEKLSLLNRIDEFKNFELTNFSISRIINSIESVTVIVPIYNAYEDTKKCLESLYKNTTINFKLILINDNSTDERIYGLLEEYQKKDNVTIYNNDLNNGFTKNVNFGIKNSGNDDVILLNSDTIVSKNWIQRIIYLAYSKNDIGTITPFSNASDISIPVIWDNNNPTYEDINNLNLILSNLNNNKKLLSPTGNGYCLFIKREAIDDVGLFDVNSFGKGYGEETDFTMRLKSKGWKNYRAPSIYIYHKKSASFSLDKADELKKEHKQIIISKHPNVFKEWDKFYNSYELQNTLSVIEDSILNFKFSLKKNILVLTSIKNGLPMAEDINDNFNNLFYITYSNNELNLWIEDDNNFSIVKTLKTDPEFLEYGSVNKFYIELIDFFNITELYVHHTLTIEIIPEFSFVMPLVLLEKLGIDIKFIRPNNLNVISDISNSYQNLDFHNKKCAVYTAITGGYDNLNDPEYIDEDFDYICFTDNPDLKSNIWEIRLIDTDESNYIQKAREIKILAHKYLKEYDYSFWVDGSFTIIGDLKKYLSLYLKESPLLMVKHIRRDCIYEEILSCIRNKKDDENIILKQRDNYEKFNYPKHNGLVESGFIFRNHQDKKLKKVMDDWYSEIQNYSIRDQISFNYVIWKNEFEYDVSDIIIWKNQFIEHKMIHNK